MTTTASRIAYARMQARAKWSPIVNTGTVTCRRCHQPITPDPTQTGDGWDIGHPTDRPAASGNISGDMAPEHRDCNRAGLVVTEPPAFTGWAPR